MPPAIALTFDNLGEAADLERGLWPAERPLGRHPSVTTALPRLLDELDALGLRATFFVEALSCTLYPAAVREIDARGHELALHGWRHEQWDVLTPADEDRLLARGRLAFAALSIEVEGFRPPGGTLTADSPRLLRAHGFRWCSAAGDDGDPWADGLARLPFQWTLVDAFHLLPSFRAARERLGAPGEPAEPEEAARRMIAALEAVASGGAGTPQSLILHPFLMLEDGGWAAARAVLRHVHRLAAGGAARIGPARDIVGAVR